MSIAQLLALLESLAAPISAVIKPELLALEAQGYTSLKAIIDAKVSSPDLHDALVLIEGALDAFVKLEVNKLP